MEAQKYSIINNKNEIILSDISEEFVDFIEDMIRIKFLYKRQKYTQAECLRDSLSLKLDDIMRSGE